MTDLGLGFRIDQVKNPAGYAFPVLTDARGVRRPATAEEAQMWALLSRLLAAAARPGGRK